MPAFTATAPAKIILFGEHAVVYGRPAIAIPVTEVKARAVVTPAIRGTQGSVHIQAPDIDLEDDLSHLPDAHPLAATIRQVLSALGVPRSPACIVRVTSTIPVAAGLGSGTAVTIAILRAYAAFLGRPLSDERVSELAYEVEKLYHGTPSGIDNTVITYAMPVYFQRQERGSPLIETFRVSQPFSILIADTGISSPTSTAVGDVRKAWQAELERYEALFDAAGEIAHTARQLIERGSPDLLGPLMDRNQALLQQMGVSSPDLERLITAARSAGALGAKLSGGGRGGNMIALIPAEKAEQISVALKNAGAVRTIVTRIGDRGAGE